MPIRMMDSFTSSSNARRVDHEAMVHVSHLNARLRAA
jgi:hypothetical protein